MPDTIPHDPIDPALADLLALFEGPLQAVRFPDVDHGTLTELADGVRRCADDVEQARAMLEAAEAALEERKQALLARAQRALAYARVYADGNAELRAQLEQIALPGSALRARIREPEAAQAGEPAPRKRGRPRKVREEEEAPPLFELPTGGEAAAAE